jgi:periplasmic protein TonB
MASIALTSPDKNEKKDRALAVLITLLIHGGIFLFLLLYIIITPLPPYPDAPTPEIVLDFGGGGGGSGSVAASSMGSKASTDNKMNQAAKAPTANAPTITNDVEPSKAIPSNTAKVQPKHIDTVPKPPQQPSVELANAENKFKNAKGSNGGNAAQGSQGPGGSGNGTSQGPGTGPGTGAGPGGSGKGFDFNLNGRQLVTRPRLVTNNPEQGQIVVGITVDQDGNVTDATPGVKGTTINDASLYELVKDAALKTKFNKSSGDTPEQYGTITFKFVIQ